MKQNKVQWQPVQRIPTLFCNVANCQNIPKIEGEAYVFIVPAIFEICVKYGFLEVIDNYLRRGLFSNKCHWTHIRDYNIKSVEREVWPRSMQLVSFHIYFTLDKQDMWQFLWIVTSILVSSNYHYSPLNDYRIQLLKWISPWVIGWYNYTLYRHTHCGCFETDYVSALKWPYDGLIATMKLLKLIRLMLFILNQSPNLDVTFNETS